MERRKVVGSWQKGASAALATLVRVEGSSYRAPGARLLVARDGTYVGSISGGCLEAEIVRKAQWMVRSGPIVQRYSTAFDDTAEIPYGLGCGGVVDVLIEPAGSPEFEALMDALEASLNGEIRHVTTSFNTAGHLRRTVTDDHGRPLFSSPEPAGHTKAGEPNDPGDTGNVGDRAPAVGSEEAGRPVPSERLRPSETIVISEDLQPPQRLVILGAGDDAQPLVSMATLLGWAVDVADHRPQRATPARFPQAARVVAATTPDVLAIGPGDAVVLMTHSYEQDRSWLEQVLPLEPRYLGLLGSRHRSALLLAESATALGWPLERACRGLSSPVGMDLGGDGAEAIALSIVAEVQAWVHGKVGQSRVLTPAIIQQQIGRGGASRYLQSQCAV